MHSAPGYGLVGALQPISSPPLAARAGRQARPFGSVGQGVNLEFTWRDAGGDRPKR
jgi:hypothetical protein